MTKNTVDVLLIGGGIMSATLATLLKQVQPDWSVALYERFATVASESTNAWNNAGTGHAALCELNYMPEAEDGTMSPAKAISINEQFQLSREWWSSLVRDGVLGSPETFINATPHMTFVKGEENVDFLRRRAKILKAEPLFQELEFSDDPATIAQWAPMLVERRAKSEVIAATRSLHGTDVDFGAVTRQLIDQLVADGMQLHLNHEVRSIERDSDGLWQVTVRNNAGYQDATVSAKFVFVGAGGDALHLLQSSGIPEIRGFGGFPISGQFLRCDNPEIVALHKAKVYGKAAVGAPPMSVPHLDTRVVDGQESLLFGPYAGFSPKFLKKGSWWDLPGSIRWHNLMPMIRVGLREMSLVKYLITEVLAGRTKRMAALREFMPTAKNSDWQLITAGQRVQVMKKDEERGGILQFGTEVIAAEDGSIAGLLGASPGASIAVDAMLGVMRRCFPEQYENKWKAQIQQRIPSLDTELNANPEAVKKTLSETSKTLGLVNVTDQAQIA